MRLFELLDLDPALAGDLLEERARGRSAIWYWRQVLIAAWTGLWSAIRDHKLLALRAVAVGFAIEYFFLFLWYKCGYLLPKGPILSTQQWTIQLSVVLITQAATGWIVARTHRAHRVPMVLLFLICDLIWYMIPTFYWVRMLLVDSIDQPRFRPYLAYYLSNVITLAVGVLVGGILARRKSKGEPHEVARNSNPAV